MALEKFQPDWENLRTSLMLEEGEWFSLIGDVLPEHRRHMIDTAFLWDSTPQGHGYWSSLADNIWNFDEDEEVEGNRPFTEEDFQALYDLCEVKSGPAKIEDYL